MRIRMDTCCTVISVVHTLRSQDIDGHTQVYVGVDASTCYGYVGLQKGRSASETLESVKTFESELKQHSGDPDRRVVGFHHDDDKSLRGPVEKYAQESDSRHTHWWIQAASELASREEDRNVESIV